MFNYTNIGFLALKLIAFLCILIGYFMNTQELNKAQQDKGSPLFQDKKDYFYYEFKRVIMVVDEKFNGFDSSDVYYHIDSQFNIYYDVLYNTVIHGISPIAQLQYWNLQYKNLDSVTYQLKKHNKTSFLSSYKAYSDFDSNFEYSLLNDGNQLIEKLKKENYSFYYVDNLQLSTLEYDSLINEIDDTTMLIILRFDKVYFHTKRERLSKELHLHKNYLIDSLTSTISCLLDIPIPLENHGVLLPGLIYKTNSSEDINLIQLNDYMINLYQLYEHYTLIEKQKSIKYQKDLDLFASQFQLVLESQDQTQINNFLNVIMNELVELSNTINAEISGSIIVLLIGLTLTLYVVYIIFFKHQSLEQLDYMVLGLSACFAFSEWNWIKVLALIAILQRLKILNVQTVLGFVLLLSTFPFYQILWIGSIIYLFIKYGAILVSLSQKSKRYIFDIIGIIFVLVGISYVKYFLIIIIPLIIYFFRNKIDIAILLICFVCRWQNFLPIILISFQYFKENESSYFKFPVQLIINVLYITVTHPNLPSSPVMVQMDAYWHIMDIIGLICCQQFFNYFISNINGSLEINEQSVIQSIQQMTNQRIEYYDNIILQLIIEIIWIIELIVTEIFSSNMETIGNQYFTLQFCIINLLMIFFYVIREGKGRIVEFIELPEIVKEGQNSQQPDTSLREIEI